MLLEVGADTSSVAWLLFDLYTSFSQQGRSSGSMVIKKAGIFVNFACFGGAALRFMKFTVGASLNSLMAPHHNFGLLWLHFWYIMVFATMT